MMIAREELHELLDRLPEDALPALRQVMSMLSATTEGCSLQFPVDDEPLTVEEEAAIAEGWAALARGEHLSQDELIARSRARRERP